MNIPPEMWLTVHNTETTRLQIERRSRSVTRPGRRRATARSRFTQLRIRTSSKGQK